MKKIKFFKVIYSDNDFDLVITELELTAEKLKQAMIDKIRKQHGFDLSLIKLEVEEITREKFFNLRLIDSLECKLFDLPN